jgi:hypothetical protein
MITAKNRAIKNDGVFAFNINNDSTTIVKGSWKANDLKRPWLKRYTVAQKFEYKPDVGEWPGPPSVY